MKFSSAAAQMDLLYGQQDNKRRDVGSIRHLLISLVLLMAGDHVG